MKPLALLVLLLGWTTICHSADIYKKEDVLIWLKANSFGYSVLEHAVRSPQPDDSDNSCLRQVHAILQAADAKEVWALKLLDAWGKYPAGLLYGRFVDMGNYDECLTLASSPSRYCLSSIPFDNLVDDEEYTVPLNIRIGTCIPAECSVTQLDMWLKDYLGTLFADTTDFNGTDFNLTASLVNEDSCTASRTQPFTALDWFAVAVLICLALLVLGCTGGDYLASRVGDKLHPLLTAFSLRVNVPQLLRVSSIKSPNVISCLHGIRCLTILWIICGHDYMFLLLSPNVNALEVIDWAQSPFSLFLQSGAICVDSFFFLSGMLLVMTTLRTMNKTNGKLNVPYMYLHRYLRLTPVLALAVLFFVTLFRHVGNGPIWNEFTGAYHLCDNTWWATLLYVQNYAAPGRMCLGHSWYLAVDMQLYILSPILLIALYKWHKKAVAAIIVFALLLVGCLFSIVMVNRLQVFNPYGNLGKDTELMRKTYYKTHTRALPWLIGCLFGYYLHCRQGRRVQLSKLVVVGCWLLALATFLAALFVVYPKTQPGATPITPISGAFYLTFVRIGWPLALCWVVFACMNGYGEPANTILSWSFWQPISKLSYCMYIWHLLVEMVNTARLKTNTHFSDYDAILHFLGDFSITMLTSAIMYVTIEAPMVGVEKYLFSPNRKHHKIEMPKNDNDNSVAQHTIVAATISQENLVHNP